MSVSSTHPEYDNMEPFWAKGEDAYSGQQKIKNEGEKYLPATEGMILDGMANVTDLGYRRYDAYKMRAVYPEYVKESIERNIGRLHLKAFDIKLPARLEPMRDNATPDGDTLLGLLVRINTQQMVTGRVGALLTLPMGISQDNPMPAIVLYHAKAVRNWNTVGGVTTEQMTQLVTLDESGDVFNPETFAWEHQERYRVLYLGNVNHDDETVQGDVKYQAGVFNADDEFATASLKTPMVMNKPLSRIPFEFINTKDLVAQPDRPPLDTLCNHALTEYRGEADYRNALHQQGGETLVIIGGTQQHTSNENSNEFNDDTSEGTREGLRTGEGSAIHVDVEGDAKYIGVSAKGLVEQRKSLENDRSLGQSLAGNVVKDSKQVEASDTIGARIGAQTATLNQISVSSAKGLENLLKLAAEWVNANPDEVSVVPNQDYDPQQFTTETLKDLATAKLDGLPLSQETIHAFCKERGFTQKEWSEELALLEAERTEQQKREDEIAKQNSKGGNDPAEDKSNVDKNKDE